MAYYPPVIQPYQNVLINGGLDLRQRGTSFTFAGAATGYTLDRWQYSSNLAGATFTVSQNADVPTIAEAGQIFPASLNVNCDVAAGVVGVNSFAFIRQRIEGYNFAPYRERPLFLYFWAKTSLAGKYSVAFRNTGSDRSCVVETPTLADGVWSLVAVPIPPSLSAGTWNYINGVGLDVIITLVAGDNLRTPTALTWQANDDIQIPSSNNLSIIAGRYLRVCGLWLSDLEGPQRFIPRLYNAELSLAQRYYDKSYAPETNPGTSTGAGAWSAVARGVDLNTIVTMPFHVMMRTTPTCSVYSTTGAINNWRDILSAADLAAGVLVAGASSAVARPSANTLNGFMYLWHHVADAEL